MTWRALTKRSYEQPRAPPRPDLSRVRRAATAVVSPETNTEKNADPLKPRYPILSRAHRTIYPAGVCVSERRPSTPMPNTREVEAERCSGGGSGTKGPRGGHLSLRGCRCRLSWPAMDVASGFHPDTPSPHLSCVLVLDAPGSVTEQLVSTSPAGRWRLSAASTTPSRDRSGRCPRAEPAGHRARPEGREHRRLASERAHSDVALRRPVAAVLVERLCGVLAVSSRDLQTVARR